MVPGGRLDGGAQGISLPVRKAIQSIKEVVLDHSDADIYAALKECDMDPNDTAQKLLNQDPFHEVKRRRDKRKENTGYRGSGERNIQPESNIQRSKPYTSWDRNAWRGGQTRKIMPGTNREFRVVRDNRVNQKAFKDQDSNRDVKTELLQDSSSDNQQVKSNSTDRSSSGLLISQKQPASRNSERHVVTQGSSRHSGSVIDHAENGEVSGGQTTGLLNEKNMPLPKSSRSETGESQIIPQICSTTSGSTNLLIGVYSSSSDPVHVPSPDSRSAGSVGAIGREIRAVGAWRQPSDCPLIQQSVSNSSLSTQQLRKDITSPKESEHSKSASQSHQTASLETSICNMPLGKALHCSRLQQPVANQKAMQPNMEWKPKTSQKPSAASGGILVSSSLSSSSCPDNSISSNSVEVAGLSENVSQVNISEEEHVIIPPHIRLPESQRVHFTFGSFGAEFEPSKVLSSSQASQDGEEFHDESAVSVSTSVPVCSGEDASADEQADQVDSGGRVSPSESPESAIESEKPHPGNDESSSPPNIDGYTDVSLVQSHNFPYRTSEPQLQNYPSAPSFPSYNPQTSYDMPFFRTTLEDNVRGQNFVSTSEQGFNSQAASNSPQSTVAMVQPQQPLQQQQQHQPMAQMYPQIHFPHLPNFVPYRHVYSPVYAPPVAMPNYPSNTAYPHPSNASSYLMMPGGTSHITTGAAKYGTSQYKPLPTGTLAGFGNFTNPAGYTITTPGAIGTTTNLDDTTRMKYKDNNLYAPNPQAETPDMWIQTPRELPNLQSAPYYNLTGQAPQPAYLPAHAGHASFNATAQPHVQYPGLYHPSQPASIATPHHLVHQQMPPGMGGTVGVGLATPAPQVGAYQPTQMGHLNWSANF